jgi:hypothetical protein
MALSTLSGLLAGTVDLQQRQQPQSSQPAPAQQPQQQPHPQQVQQPQRPGLGQQQQQPAGQRQQSLPQQQGLPQRQLPVINRRQPQKPQLSVSEDVALKLKVALIQMLEAEEKYLQVCWRMRCKQPFQLSRTARMHLDGTCLDVVGIQTIQCVFLCQQVIHN